MRSDDPERRRALLQALLLGTAAIALVTWLRLRFDARLWDDAYITMNAVRHLLDGSGLHFNPQLQDHALTTLLWPLLIAFGTGGGAEMPSVVRGLGMLSEFLLAGCFGLYTRRITGSVAGGLLAMALLLCNPVVLLCSFGGMETGIALALMAASLWLLSADRHRAALVVAALVLWTRFDGLLFYGVVLASAAVVVPRDRYALRGWLIDAAPSLLLVSGYFAFTRLYFDRWLPDSVTVKLELAGGLSPSAEVARELWHALLGQSSYWFRVDTPYLWTVPLILLGGVSLAVGKRTRRQVAPLLAFTFLYAASIWLRGGEYATHFPWYFAPPLLCAGLLATEGLLRVGAALHWLATRAALPAVPARLAATAPVLLCLVLGVGWVAVLDAPLADSVRLEKSRQQRREVLYAAIATWTGQILEGSEERWLAGNEIGALGYFAPARLGVIDLFGLSQAKGEASLSGSERVAKYQPAVVITNRKKRREEIDRLLAGRYRWQLPRTGESRILLVGIRHDLEHLNWRLGPLERAFRHGDLLRPSGEPAHP
jgi:hypothetical protein